MDYAEWLGRAGKLYEQLSAMECTSENAEDRKRLANQIQDYLKVPWKDAENHRGRVRPVRGSQASRLVADELVSEFARLSHLVERIGGLEPGPRMVLLQNFRSLGERMNELKIS